MACVSDRTEKMMINWSNVGSTPRLSLAASLPEPCRSKQVKRLPQIVTRHLERL
jgi:hypothetical protein